MPAVSAAPPVQPAVPPVAKRATAVPPARLASPLVERVVARDAQPELEKRPPRAIFVEVDTLGVGWDMEHSRVVLGAITIPLMPIEEPRLGESVRTVSRRVYDTLYDVYQARDLDWQEFLSHLRVQREWFSNLLTSQSQLTPAILKNIIEGLRQHYQLDLTPAQLFGLSALPSLVGEAEKTIGAGKTEEYLFPFGDTKLGLMCSMMLRKYMSVRRWFEKTYGLTAAHLEQIEAGRLRMPLAVYLVMMHKVQERIDSVEGIQLPTVYKRLMALPQSKPISNRTHVLDEINIPGRDWLR